MTAKTDVNDRFVIIMAGGRGERFWPVSREKTPKQLLALLGRKSFLQEAVDRVLPLVPLKNILVITNEVQAPQVAKQLPKLPKQNIIAEPVGRDTCAAVTLGAAIVGARSTTARASGVSRPRSEASMSKTIRICGLCVLMVVAHMGHGSSQVGRASCRERV